MKRAVEAITQEVLEDKLIMKEAHKDPTVLLAVLEDV